MDNNERSIVLGYYSLPDGYNGDRRNCYVLYFKNRIFHVYNDQYHPSGIFPNKFDTSSEALKAINSLDGIKYYMPVN